jgi:hypothetical protein
MECSVPSLDIQLDADGCVIDLGSLYANLAGLHDKRHARGLRHALVTVLVYVVLAKLAGQDRVYGISQWVKHRQTALAEAFALAVAKAPSVNTYRRVLAVALDIEEFEQVVREFFAGLPQAGQSVVIALDGKALRGTIPAGQTHGRHLLAAYLPAEGWVLYQVEVVNKENEISAAPCGLKCLDLRGKVVTWDATPALALCASAVQVCLLSASCLNKLSKRAATTSGPSRTINPPCDKISNCCSSLNKR